MTNYDRVHASAWDAPSLVHRGTDLRPTHPPLTIKRLPFERLAYMGLGAMLTVAVIAPACKAQCLYGDLSQQVQCQQQQNQIQQLQRQQEEIQRQQRNTNNQYNMPYIGIPGRYN